MILSKFVHFTKGQSCIWAVEKTAVTDDTYRDASVDEHISDQNWLQSFYIEALMISSFLKPFFDVLSRVEVVQV